MSQGQMLALPVGSRDHATGHEGAPITLVEYGDYECGFCGRAYPIVKNIRRHFGDQLRFVFRNFPLTRSHPHAEMAAEVAEAAAAQGKFWEMHDRLFEHQSKLERSDLIEHAAHLKLDIKRIGDELERRVHLARVKEDYESGANSGIDGTPGFFINGVQFEGDWGGPELLETLKRLAKPHS